MYTRIHYNIVYNFIKIKYILIFLDYPKFCYWIRSISISVYLSSWIFLRFFILSAWFVNCFCGASFNYILSPALAQNTYLDTINILYFSHRVSPDPRFTRIVKFIIDVDSQYNSKSVYSVHHSIMYKISQRSVTRTDFLIDRGVNGSITNNNVRVFEN